MTITIVISFCILLLIAYIFDLTSSKTKIPSVIFLLLLGWTVRQVSVLFNIQLPDFSPILPALGTIGLILIVMEGSLELELHWSKVGLLKRSFLGAILSLLTTAILLAFLFRYYGGLGLKDSLINAVPLCVISSAIAIPSVRSLSSRDKEFVIYESSISDILGVILFNFLVLNESISAVSFGHFLVELLIIIVVSFIATIGLSFLLSKIEHPVKFVPIILLVVLIYFVFKIYHLPGLLFILLFGLTIGNVLELKRFKWIEFFKPDELAIEVKRFKEITAEITFLIRSLFFLLFGYLIETEELLNPTALNWAIVIVAIIYIFRFIQIKLSGLSVFPLLFIAPRGLITILLFLSIDPAHAVPFVNKSLILQVIILSALFMMVGLIASRREANR